MGSIFSTGGGSQQSLSRSESASQNQSASGLTPEQILSAYIKVLPKLSKSAAETQAALLQPDAAGWRAATSGNALMRELNPEYYDALASAGKGAKAGVDASDRLLKSIDLSGLSPGEYNATERALNKEDTRTGNAGLINPMNVIKNAMNFGGAFNNKLGLLQNAVSANSNAVGSAASAAGAGSPSTSGFNAFTAATGGGDTLANNFLNAITRRSTSSGGSYAKSISFGEGSSNNTACCFIFMEAYNGPLPPTVRHFRDRYYKLRPDIATGYKKMAKWLVPLMRDYNTIRNLVWNFMIAPATRYSINPKHGKDKSISHFWLRVWSFYGKF